MKKITLFAAVLTVLAFTSCKKAYTCSCTTTFSYGGGIAPDSYKDDSEVYSAKMNEKTAKSACDNKEKSLDASYTNAFTDNGADPNPGISARSECELTD